MDLKNLRKGRVFVDANIFLAEILEEDAADECMNFLQRISSGELKGSTSSIVLNEVFHRTLIADAIATYNLKGWLAVNYLKRNPDKIKELTNAHTAIENICIIPNLDIIDPNMSSFYDALKISIKYGLLSSDAWHVSLMLANNIENIATLDPDFQRVDKIKVWRV
ncbi:MAG: hypothetical protein CVT88_09945 [Candidatus Altiarchaeales archaeon HGW-Altiarchaeales-1]|nr:MAG: hypothetical protein CVT89_07580 [Candidatus Altiarchaeales archaeon HGW-Altiarchaeales-2]PKP56674.1 MAG: hypothetical protein CVT88_09945 [Candidatus Altiarchaeales archaeon HGW-Altiarchaeales-1]